MSTLLYIMLLLQLVTFIIALIKFKSFSFNYMVILLVMFFFSMLTEIIGVLIIKYNVVKFNVHYFYALVLFNLIYFFYRTIINNKSILKMMNLLTIFFSLVWCVAFYRRELFYYMIILGALNTVVYAFIYLKELLVSDKILNYKKLLPFWITVGFLVFYLPSIPFFSMLNYMHTRGLFFILYILIILMNLFFIYGLLCSKKEERY